MTKLDGISEQGGNFAALIICRNSVKNFKGAITKFKVCVMEDQDFGDTLFSNFTPVIFLNKEKETFNFQKWCDDQTQKPQIVYIKFKM